jgi:hypothetical protein
MLTLFLAPNFKTHPITTTTLMAYSVVLSTALLFTGSLALEGTQLQAPKQKVSTGYFIAGADKQEKFCLNFRTMCFVLLATHFSLYPTQYYCWNTPDWIFPAVRKWLFSQHII